MLDLLRRLAAEKGATPAQISLAWMLCKKPWIVPIPGTRRADRMRENAGAAGVRLSPEAVQNLDAALGACRCPQCLAWRAGRGAERNASSKRRRHHGKERHGPFGTIAPCRRSPAPRAR